MKSKVVLALIFSLFISTSHAATQAKQAVKMTGLKATTMISLSSDPNDQVSALVTSPTSLTVVGTSGKSGFATSYDRTGTVQQWNLVLGAESIATVASRDSAGTLWIAGASAIQPDQPATSAYPAGTLNPSGVQPDTSTALPAMTQLNIWKVSAQGVLINTYSTNKLGDAILPESIGVKSGKVTVTGLIASHPLDRFSITLDSQGALGAAKISTTVPSTKAAIKEVKTTLSIWRFFTTSVAIKGIPTWKPKPNAHVLVRYDAKSKAVIAGYTTSGEILDFAWEKSIGIIALIEYPTFYGLAIIK